MPRRPRLIVPGIPLHIIQRGNNCQACFFTDEDYLFYLDWLGDYAKMTDCAVHAYVLMTNHVHLILTPAHLTSAGNLMKRLGQRYVQYVNRTYDRSGTLWKGRFRSSIVQQEEYLFTCQKYIETNPVRPNMVEHPGEYRWSSYQANGHGEKSKIITPHFLYESRGTTPAKRELAYRELFRRELESGEIDIIRKATNGNSMPFVLFQQNMANGFIRNFVSDCQKNCSGLRTRILEKK